MRVFVVLVLIAAACGGDDAGGGGGEGSVTTTSSASGSGDSLPERPGATTTEAPGTTSAPVDEPNLVCESAEPIEIGLGESVDGVAEQGLGNQCFWVDVPAGLDSITVQISGLTGNVNASVAYGYLPYIQYPGVGPYWLTESEDVAEKSVVVERPEAGPHIVLVGPARPRVESPYTLVVTAEPATTTTSSGRTLPAVDDCTPPATELMFGEPFQDELTAEASEGRDWRPRKYYCVVVPDGVASITVELSGVDGFIELFTRRGSTFLGTDRARTGPTRTVVIDDVEAGVYYVDVAAALDGGASPFTLIVRET